MNRLSLSIAWRYLFGKKSTNAINLITGLSILGLVIGTAALVLILSVFNGFEGLLSGLFNAFNPDLKISPASGKTMVIDSITLDKITKLEGVKHVSQTLEEVALFEYRDVQEIGIIKGVDENYKLVTGLDSTILLGRYGLTGRSGLSYCILGIGIRNKLSVNIEDKLNPITVYMPLKKVKIPGTKEFKFRDAYPAGIFSVRSENDQQYVISSLKFTRDLLNAPNGMVSYLELKIMDNTNTDLLRKNLSEIIPHQIEIKNRYQQDASFLKIMNIEKWVSFFIVSLTLLLIVFNLVGAIWMIVLEKKKDISILKAMGYTDKSIGGLFLSLGLLICILSVVIGFIVSIFIYFLQKKYGLVGIPEGFLLEAYPIQLKFIDFIRVAVTVMTIGFLASLLPAKKAANMDTLLRTD